MYLTRYDYMYMLCMIRCTGLVLRAHRNPGTSGVAIAINFPLPSVSNLIDGITNRGIDRIYHPVTGSQKGFDRETPRKEWLDSDPVSSNNLG